MRLKLRDTHFRCNVANKCLNNLRGIKIVPSLVLLSCESLVPVKRNLDRKQIAKNLYFVENSDFIGEITELGFRSGLSVNSQENNRDGALF